MQNSIFIKILWGFMGLYLFNISVDTVDSSAEQISENLSFNDQESIVEIVVEQMLGYENAIKEYDGHDNEDNNNKKNVKTDLDVHQINTILSTHQELTRDKTLYPDYEVRLTNSFKKIDSPPPKV